MSSQVELVLEALKQQVRNTLQATVRTVAWAPQDWDEDYIKRIALQLPAVFVVFAGAVPRDMDGASVPVNTRWVLVAVTAQKQGAEARALGDQREIGGYEIIERLIGACAGWLVKPFGGGADSEIGTLRFVEWDVTAEQQLEKIALSIQSASFEIDLSLDRAEDGGDLSPFVQFDGTFDIGQASGAPPTDINVTLEQ